MLVVEISSMGEDIFFCRIVPAEKDCLVVEERCGTAETSPSEGFLVRFVLTVNARERDIFQDVLCLYIAGRETEFCRQVKSGCIRMWFYSKPTSF
jgi:hypothetical protein